MIQIGSKLYNSYEDFQAELNRYLTSEQDAILNSQAEPGRAIAMDIFAQDLNSLGNGRIREAFGMDDFGALMTNNIARSIMRGSVQEPAWWPQLVRIRTNVPKTKGINPILLGSFKEYKKNTGGSDSQNAQKFTVADGISYDMDIFDAEFVIDLLAQGNDDLGAFLGTAQRFGASATLTVNQFVRRLIEGLKDDDSTDSTAKYNTTSAGSATKLYDSSVHKNYLGDSKSLTVDNVKDAIGLLESQKDIDGSPIVQRARFLVVDSKHRLTAQSIVNSPRLVSTDAAKTPEGNPVAGEVTVLPIHGIARNSGNAWYIVADPQTSDVVELAFFRDRQAPTLLAEPDNAGESFNKLVRRWKAWLLFGGHALNPRSYVGANFAE